VAWVVNARALGIVAAGIAAITAFSWMPYYPVWALIYVVIAIFVIYALVAPFRDEVTMN
jgi:hypothetical protein